MDFEYPQILKTPWGDLGLIWENGFLIKAYFISESFIAKNPSIAFEWPQYPLQFQGSEFAIQVWKEVQKISYGTTCTYSDLAKRLNRPLAVRAVASAVARNPLALFVPCHRIVPKSGGWGNYRWGSNRKKAILESEIQNEKDLVMGLLNLSHVTNH